MFNTLFWKFLANEKINELLEDPRDLDDSDLNGVLQEQTADTHDMLATLEGARLDCQICRNRLNSFNWHSTPSKTTLLLMQQIWELKRS